MTVYDPQGFYLFGINVLLNILFGLTLQYYPLRRFLRVRPRTAVLLNAGLIVLCAGIFFVFPPLLSSAGVSQIAATVMYIALFIPLAFCLLKGCAPQNLFASTYVWCLSLFVLGVGNWLEFRFGDLLLPGTGAVALLARLILIPIFLPLGVRTLEKMFKAWSGNESNPFWRVVWLIPAAMFAITMLSANAWTLTDANSIIFLLTRILSVSALMTCVAMMTGIMSREREMATARMREEMLDTVTRAQDKSHVKILSEWEAATVARQDARTAVEKILNHTRADGHAEISCLLLERMEGLELTAPLRLCENEAVNALAAHYSVIACEEGIEVSCRLDIPKQAGRVRNVDLSRIVGNMLENAVEACRRMDRGARSIRLKSMLRDDMLVLVMDNSFDGNVEELPDGRYVSRKRESGVATGLSSIQALADRYDGTALFEPEGRVFKTSVRLDMSGFLSGT
ncbi:MAG: ATP-binding protein [Clostridia bacterium]|nr:ATP-binding protein [Clostridia bacterium]